LLFVGLPLLAALVLMATPLHDAPAPLPPVEAPAALIADWERAAALRAEWAPTPEIRERQAAVARPYRKERPPVPEVIFETRRTMRRAPTAELDGRAPAPASSTASPWLRRSPTEARTLSAIVARAQARGGATSETQSP
jgi:hypothetical protein